MSKKLKLEFFCMGTTGGCERTPAAVNEQTNEQEEPFPKLHTAGPAAAKQKHK
jgi:hypothetical protein